MLGHLVGGYIQGPSLVKSAKEDGDTLHAVFYYALRKETAEALQDVAAAEPAVKLLVEYCRYRKLEQECRAPRQLGRGLIDLATRCTCHATLATVKSPDAGKMRTQRGIRVSKRDL